MIATCVYEVHTSRSLHDSVSLKDEHFFIKNDELIGFAVEVERPVMDLNSLLNFWKGPLSQEREEYYSDEKVLYIINQVQRIVRDLKSKDISHGNLRASSIFID